MVFTNNSSTAKVFFIRLYFINTNELRCNVKKFMSRGVAITEFGIRKYEANSDQHISYKLHKTDQKATFINNLARVR